MVNSIKNLKKSDGSFNITINGMPYNTNIGDKYYNDTLNLYNSNPELFDIEIEETELEKLNKTIKELKLQKKLELKQKRDNYLKLKGYNLSDNDKFNIINLLDNYTEEDKNNYINFLNNNLIPKYNTINKAIEEADTIEDVENIAIDFGGDNFNL